MSTLWKRLVILAIAHAVGGLLFHKAALCEASPVRSVGAILEGGCVAETEAPHRRGYVAFVSSLEVSSPGVESRSYFESSHFAEVLGKHDAFLPQMALWRWLLAAHASALARLVKTFPGTEHLSEERIREVLRSRSGLPAGAPGGDVFWPWANAWSGQWGDGSPQYHIWDPARCHEGQWVQLVAQSETAFPEAARLEAMVGRGETDLAVNVFSERFGITGWVSKRQHGPLEIPCIGYLLEPAVLLWICRTSGRPYRMPAHRMPAQKALAQDGWFAYLESVEASTGSPIYHIYGNAVEITSRGIGYGTRTSLHTGHYRAR